MTLKQRMVQVNREKKERERKEREKQEGEKVSVGYRSAGKQYRQKRVCIF
jgi:50S ribosomal subunit-associated GTPase HflX